MSYQRGIVVQQVITLPWVSPLMSLKRQEFPIRDDDNKIIAVIKPYGQTTIIAMS